MESYVQIQHPIRVRQADIFLADIEAIINALKQTFNSNVTYSGNTNIYLGECDGLNENYHLANNIVIRYYDNSINETELKAYIINTLDNICNRMPRKYKVNKSFDLQKYYQQFDNYEQRWSEIVSDYVTGKYIEIQVEIEKLGREKFHIIPEHFNNIVQQYEKRDEHSPKQSHAYITTRF